MLISCIHSLWSALESNIPSLTHRKRQLDPSDREDSRPERSRARVPRTQPCAQSQSAVQRNNVNNRIGANSRGTQHLDLEPQSEIATLKLQLQNGRRENENYRQQLSVAGAELETQERTLDQLQTDLDDAVHARILCRTLFQNTKAEIQQKEDALETFSEQFRCSERQRAEVETELRTAKSGGDDARLQVEELLQMMSQKDEAIRLLENKFRDQQAGLDTQCGFCQDDKVPHDVSNSIWEEWLDQSMWEGSDTSRDFS